jgi:hypothetical protein
MYINCHGHYFILISLWQFKFPTSWILFACDYLCFNKVDHWIRSFCNVDRIVYTCIHISSTYIWNGSDYLYSQPCLIHLRLKWIKWYVLTAIFHPLTFEMDEMICTYSHVSATYIWNGSYDMYLQHVSSTYIWNGSCDMYLQPYLIHLHSKWIKW